MRRQPCQRKFFVKYQTQGSPDSKSTAWCANSTKPKKLYTAVTSCVPCPTAGEDLTSSTLLIRCYSERKKHYIKQKRQLSKAVLIERWSVLLEQCFVWCICHTLFWFLCLSASGPQASSIRTQIRTVSWNRFSFTPSGVSGHFSCRYNSTHFFLCS